MRSCCSNGTDKSSCGGPFTRASKSANNRLNHEDRVDCQCSIEALNSGSYESTMQHILTECTHPGCIQDKKSGTSWLLISRCGRGTVPIMGISQPENHGTSSCLLFTLDQGDQVSSPLLLLKSGHRIYLWAIYQCILQYSYIYSINRLRQR
jgi:hypothetical protein